MKIARLAGLVLAAVMMLSLAAVATASAEPLISPVGGTFTALTGTTKLIANNGVDVVTCAKSTSPGEITNVHLIKIVLHFLECTGSENKDTPCPVKSEGAPAENLIITKTLHGVLGLILPHIPATLLLPIAGKEFVGLEPSSAGCITATAVTGNIAGEYTTAAQGVSRLTGKLNFGPLVSQHFEPSLGGLVLAKLTAFTTVAGEEAEATIDYNQLTEVT